MEPMQARLERLRRGKDQIVVAFDVVTGRPGGFLENNIPAKITAIFEAWPKIKAEIEEESTL